MIYIELVKDTKNLTITAKRMLKDKRKRVIFMTPEIFAKFFSPERIRLMMYLKEHKVESISDLARKLGRRFEAVHRDIKYLDSFIKIKRVEANKVPYIDEDLNFKMVSV
ncbi:hypothetical protein ACFL6I_23860 [candidate division KSB1 bacterium]